MYLVNNTAQLEYGTTSSPEVFVYVCVWERSKEKEREGWGETGPEMTFLLDGFANITAFLPYHSSLILSNT